MGHPLQWTLTVGKDGSEDVEQFDVIIIGAGVTGLGGVSIELITGTLLR
jgi:hypothetical protein